ncbi:MAG: hypothetical protein OEM81_00170 [Acidimicrobiia bacterium]|nr:hypothetical protein [Acidimicrobiia bacterium]MDH5616420.1 hypothetical protein [Acidimicrobiia bacterium]
MDRHRLLTVGRFLLAAKRGVGEVDITKKPVIDVRAETAGAPSVLRPLDARPGTGSVHL